MNVRISIYGVTSVSWKESGGHGYPQRLYKGSALNQEGNLEEQKEE